jgi:hypothetical protein
MMDRCDDGESDLIPDNVCYSNLINVLINTSKNDDDDDDFSLIKRAEALFEEMLVQYFEGNNKAAPTTRNFNTILAALSTSLYPEAALRANNFLKKWETYNKDGKVFSKPDSYSYSLLLKCWVNSSRDDAMEMLQSTMQRIQMIAREESADGSSIVHPCEIRFTPVITAFIKNRCTQAAHDLLLHMTRIYQSSPGKSTKPESKWFQSVASLWNIHPDVVYAADHAASLLRCFEDLYDFDMSVKPNVCLYNNVLFAFRNAQQPRRAHALLSRMEQQDNKKLCIHGANKTSYHTVMDAWQNESSSSSFTSRDANKISSIRWLQKEYQKRFGHSPPPFKY